MLELELKYLELTREIVIKRADDLVLIPLLQLQIIIDSVRHFQYM